MGLVRTRPCSSFPTLPAVFVPPSAVQVHPGKNVGLGRDYTLFSLIDGVVVFEKNSRRSSVTVVPFEMYQVGGRASVCVGGGGRGPAAALSNAVVV